MDTSKELQPDSQASPPDETTVVDNKHLSEMAHALQHSHGLLGLSDTTRRLILPYISGDPGLAVFDAIKRHLEMARGTWSDESRYSPYVSYNYENLRDDTQYLSSFPGYVKQAIELFQQEAEWRLNTCYGGGNTPEDFIPIAEEFDLFMLGMLQGHIRYITEENKEWDLSEVVKFMTEQRKFDLSLALHEEEEPESDDEDPCFTEEYNPVFGRSLRFVFAWHSRKIGTLLAYKTAGHILPPELVEMIAEYFYDQKVLEGF
ncbi:Hypothetical predicted protein [Lecanosticta acicola]|uniref:Uncharacterized protein n=1 Tax=Lecanosticta acicola TaxID=111012 RepID=A0AAI8YTK4_9PEZI|nr:Hypothetical predicted protein [Lecanosticta acicola]